MYYTLCLKQRKTDNDRNENLGEKTNLKLGEIETWRKIEKLGEIDNWRLGDH